MAMSEYSSRKGVPSRNCLGIQEIMKLIETIKVALQKAKEEKKKMATFHSLVLLNADLLEHLDPKAFCQSVGVTEAYHIEFRKMIAVAHMISESGYLIQKR